MSSPRRQKMPSSPARQHVRAAGAATGRGSTVARIAKDAPPASGFHARNRHQGRYDFDRLQAAHPPLARFVVTTPAGDPTIPFADPQAVRALNRALLADQYGIRDWEIPEGFLCPAIPGRADYVHLLADLLAGEAGMASQAGSAGDSIPRGGDVRVVDVGVGANCIYPLIGHCEYGWQFVGSDISTPALAAAERLLAANPALRAAIALRRQSDPQRILLGIIGQGERFDLTMCNPPFHDSPTAALAGTNRKWRNLARNAALPQARGAKAGTLNFGGQAAELWCPGGEAAFVGRMIEESRALADRCLWFTTLVSQAGNLPRIERRLVDAGVAEMRILRMAQGQKQGRIVAWTFLPADARHAWARLRWAGRPGSGAAI